MSNVLAKDRRESKFEVIDYFNKTRKEFTDLLLRDFCYSEVKAIQRYKKAFKGKNFDELDEHQKEIWLKMQQKDEAFSKWFIKDERDSFIEFFRELSKMIYSANSVYPICREEVLQRRIFMDKAVGLCYSIIAELQYVGATLPVNLNKYTRFSDMIEKESILIKSWRSSDNKQFKKLLTEEDIRKTGENDINYNNKNFAKEKKKEFRKNSLDNKENFEKENKDTNNNTDKELNKEST